MHILEVQTKRRRWRKWPKQRGTYIRIPPGTKVQHIILREEGNDGRDALLEQRRDDRPDSRSK